MNQSRGVNWFGKVLLNKDRLISGRILRLKVKQKEEEYYLRKTVNNIGI